MNNLILTATLGSGYYYYHFHLTNDKSEVQRREKAWPRSHNYSLAEAGFKTQASGSRASALKYYPIQLYHLIQEIFSVDLKIYLKNQWQEERREEREKKRQRKVKELFRLCIASCAVSLISVF